MIVVVVVHALFDEMISLLLPITNFESVAAAAAAAAAVVVVLQVVADLPIDIVGVRVER